MKLSIIIPVYNVEAYIADCLQSVMRQTHKGPVECILVDDCSTDRSMAVVEELIADYVGPIDFRVVHHEQNQGPSVARNTGLDIAVGDYVYFLDSDDWISDDCIEKLVKPLQQEEVDIVIGNYEMVGERPYYLELSLPEGSYHEKGIRETFCNQGVYVMVWNKLYRKDFLLKNHLRFDEGWTREDEVFAFELACVEKSFYVVKEVTYFYRISENSVTISSDKLRRLDDCLGAFRSVQEKVKKYGQKEGIYDLYLFYIRKVFRWISGLELDEDMLGLVEDQTKGYLDVIPSLFCLRNKHDRLVFFMCKKDQTYSRFQYVTKEYENKIQGRVLRNVLKFFPKKR